LRDVGFQKERYRMAARGKVMLMAEGVPLVQAETRPVRGEQDVEHFDVLVVGAGLSGIGAACRLQEKCPSESFAVLEGRDTIGGTWDLFRYPGVRSDSDMYTLGYCFRPWRRPKAIVEGASILKYIRETAREYDVDSKIRFGHRVQRASWSSESAKWRIEAALPDGTTACFTTKFLFMCSGYYNYEAGYTPEWPGTERFRGRIVHPQCWPETLDYEGKRMLVIGSGATAVTLVPALAKRATHVTMLQRSPTYILALPSEDAIANWLRPRLGARIAYGFARWKSVLLSMYFYNLSRRKPEHTKKLLLRMAQKAIGPGFDAEKHFSPRYNPWDQRLCIVPDADLFSAIRSGKVSIVTDEIETFTEAGIRVKSGKELEADIIVTATGLKLKMLGGTQVFVDGTRIDLSRTLSYKGMMYSDIPNLASTFGYVNASWTLRSDLIAEYVCRLLNYMDEHAYHCCTPRQRDPSIQGHPAIPFSSGYFERAKDILPKQGSKKPWKIHQNYALDLLELRFARIDDGTMEFGRLENKRRAN
jgi:monooxygenase